MDSTPHLSNIPEKLVIPYSAVISFYDPTVQFGLQFDDGLDEASATKDDLESEAETAESAVAEEDQTDSKDKDGGVVSLDAFRKKKT